MKLSEVAAKLGVSVDDLMDQLEIDGTGKFSELAGKAGRASELEATLQQKQAALSQYEQQVMQLQQQAQATVQATGHVPEWYNDEILRPIAQSFQQLQQEVRDLQEQKIAVLAGTMQQFMQQAQTWANKMEVSEMKRQHADFDEKRVRDYAARTGIADWEAAYNGEKATRLPDIIKAEVERARLEGMSEGASRKPVDTEMGAINPAPLAGGETKDYNTAWTGLLQDFQSLGMGNH